jgi:uncharacterized protein (TIGR03435 family)
MQMTKQILVFLAASFSLLAQEHPGVSGAAFEAASIKPTQMTGQGVDIDRHQGMLVMKNVTLQDCIREAYGITDSQIAGEKWLSPDRYDVVAKIPPGTPPEQRSALLQALLAERFQLAVHRGTKELPVYVLVVAKNGPKIQAVESAKEGGVSSGPGSMSAKGITMARLALFLSSARAQLEHTVVDHTGLKGIFTFELKWTPDDKQDASTPGPSLSAALQEQLGLKLETAKAPVEILIIDHAEKPSEN